VAGVLQLQVVLQRSLRTVYFLADGTLNHGKSTCWSRTSSLNLRLCFFFRDRLSLRWEGALVASKWES
jgi:hypothetical protein